MKDVNEQSAFEIAHARVCELITRFQTYARDTYLQSGYSEAAARKDFIDPFLKALGWDVDHEREHNPYEQEVKVERAVTVARAQKRADYAFYLKPNFRDVRFFVEAKKPSVDLERSVDAHFQTLRYGYSANTPLAVLTDFEQIRVLDSRLRPHPDTVLDQVYKSWYYTDFLDAARFAEFYWLFAREAHADGSYQRRIDELPKPKGGAKQRGLFKGGYQAVDASFLAELEEHRTALAKAFKKADSSLDSETLTEIVQRTLDRLVFLRFLEDKQIEIDIRVSDFGKGKGAWLDFIAASRRLDGIYNGIVFKRAMPLDDAAFAVDDAVFGDVCEQLAAENSPYNFDAIPIHILGSIYERFLGSVIRATDKRVFVEEKPEVRKAGGVYYTPEYIVRYIVAQTVGKQIAGRTPVEIARLRFADIACGSGSFLLGIFDELLRYHAEWYNRPENDKRAKKDGCVRTEDDLWRLSLAQRRTILQNNIYGVDIDHQAVEVAQLSLFLKLLEDERATSARQYQLDYARDPNLKTLLPDLSANIVCGNSLIGWDIGGLAALDRDDERRLNPLDFAQAFPGVIRAGGFDAIVGNPPYGAELQPLERKFLTKRFDLGTTDTAALMLMAAFGLCKRNYRIGMILPKPMTYSSSWHTTRVSTQHALCAIADVGKAWKQVKLEQSICIFGNGVFESYTSLRREKEDLVDKTSIVKTTSDAFGFWLNGINKQELAVGEKLRSLGISLGGAATNRRGAMLQRAVANDGRGQIVIGGKHIDRYGTKPSALALPKDCLIPENGKIEVGAVLAQNIVAHIANPFGHIKIIATLAKKDDAGKIALDTINQICSVGSYANQYLLAIINSSLINWYMYRFVYGRAIRTMHFDSTSTDRLPIAPIDLSDKAGKARHDRIVALVDQMLAAKQQEASASGHAKEIATRKCAALDRQIDTLVYELYGLTDEEIALVEGHA